MKKKIPNLVKNLDTLKGSKELILKQWLSYDSPQKILKLHDIDKNQFLSDYANGVFDYFMGVIAGVVNIGDCPVMRKFLAFLKGKEIKTEELFDICSHFRRSIVDFTYDANINSKNLFEEISYMFDQNFQGLLGYYTDTIYQKEKEIDRHVKLLSEYQNALDESAIISKTDKDGKITYVNDKYIRISGYDADELIGSYHSIVKHQDMPEDYFKDLWFQLENMGIFRGTIKNNKKNGDYFYVDVTIVKIVDPYDNTTEYISIANDVTTLIDARLEAQKASQAKEYFLSNMSHEIRTPLNAILGFVNLLIDQDLSKQHRKYLEIILNSGENLLSIINDILDFSKLRSGEFTIEPRIFSIHSEISHTLELFVASANLKEITITSFIDPSIPKELYADSLRIKQILSNFLSNAIKFTRAKGHIHVEATCKDRILRVSVRDNGIGIAAGDISNIFTAFTQAGGAEVEHMVGTGLGLSICHQLSQHMGGMVHVSSELGQGSTFWLELPVEIHDNSCQVFNDLEEIKKYKKIFYIKDMQHDYRSASFLRYANIFGMDIEISEKIRSEHDVVIFLEEDVDEEFKEKIINSNKKYIALTNRPSDIYEKYPHISTICFPLYCSKIKAAFDELNHPDEAPLHKLEKAKKFKGHVLIAEDNEANQELVKILLERYGLTYDLANNGLEAVNLYKANNYDLILMDEQMPTMDGNEAVRIILDYEQENNLRHTPISALTANVIKGAKERGLMSGFDSFLGKPIVIKELERVFSNYLRASKIPAPNKKVATKNSSIEGLDLYKLTQELMLSESELLMLANLFIKKMSKQIPEMQEAILKRDYSKMALIAHSIKGSSGNFRLEDVQESSTKFEKMAKKKDINYNYEEAFKKIKDRLLEIKII
ncbi:MAG: ATP-binding protein [Sulfurimonas sp.]|uniref:ATP-binding protein n=1 Tax=Sulfurimonas sp. TaxID=2022749 RepID=UPI002632F4E6|nr:ATP-binding protein [Sulfurimonas sp.]MDD3475839.1 ATP-binding protein [Sulfurimonas sp.]